MFVLLRYTTIDDNPNTLTEVRGPFESAAEAGKAIPSYEQAQNNPMYWPWAWDRWAVFPLLPGNAGFGPFTDKHAIAELWDQQNREDKA